MSEQLRPFGLDQEISLAGRVTTIRKELENGNGHTMRSFVTSPGKPEKSEYWIVIYKQPSNTEMFKVIKADFDYLRGQGIRRAFS